MPVDELAGTPHALFGQVRRFSASALHDELVVLERIQNVEVEALPEAPRVLAAFGSGGQIHQHQAEVENKLIGHVAASYARTVGLAQSLERADRSRRR